MPLVSPSSYTPFFLFRNRHFQTIYPAVVRRIPGVEYRRERLELSDGDFVDLDWVDASSRRVVVLLHGLEGSAARSYIQGMARAFSAAGWNVLAMNFRGCSGETNRLLRSYHAGATEDLRAVVEHIKTSGRFDQVGLVGFSLGGNLLMKYLGEEGKTAWSGLVGAVAFSVPCNLEASVEAISAGSNRIYMRKFLRQLNTKMVEKHRLFPDEIDLTAYDEMKDFYAFDDRYTAPIHGFKNAKEYWRINSCMSFLDEVAVPSLIVNATDDPFLNKACFPFEPARQSDTVYLETPTNGGHVGFISLNRKRHYWSEQRAIQFFLEIG